MKHQNLEVAIITNGISSAVYNHSDVLKMFETLPENKE